MAIDPEQFIVERLNVAVHHRERFASGVASLDSYLKTRARQDVDRNAAVVYILSSTTDCTEIAGYYTLSSSSISLRAIPNPKTLARYPDLPAILLGRLALDSRYQRSGLGTALLMDALGRAQQVSQSIAASVVIVDAIDENAAGFYEHHDFIRCVDDPRRLFLPMRTIAALHLKPSPLPLFGRRKAVTRISKLGKRIRRFFR